MPNTHARKSRHSLPAAPRRATASPAGPTHGFDRRGLAIVFGLATAVLIAYLPGVSGAFLWDDDAHVTRPELQTLSGLWRIWFDLGATQQYYPLLHSAFWIE